jgi:hypothetical protein
MRPVLYQAKKTPPPSPLSSFPVSNFYSPLCVDDTVFPWEPGFIPSAKEKPISFEEWSSYPYVPTTRERRVVLRLDKLIAIEASNSRFFRDFPTNVTLSSADVLAPKKQKQTKTSSRSRSSLCYRPSHDYHCLYDTYAFSSPSKHTLRSTSVPDGVVPQMGNINLLRDSTCMDSSGDVHSPESAWHSYLGEFHLPFDSNEDICIFRTDPMVPRVRRRYVIRQRLSLHADHYRVGIFSSGAPLPDGYKISFVVRDSHYTIRCSSFELGQRINTGVYTLVLIPRVRPLPSVATCLGCIDLIDQVVSQAGSRPISRAIRGVGKGGLVCLGAVVGARVVSKLLGGTISRISKKLGGLLEDVVASRSSDISTSMRKIANELNVMITQRIDQAIEGFGIGDARVFIRILPVLVAASWLFLTGKRWIGLALIFAGLACFKNNRNAIYDLWSAFASRDEVRPQMTESDSKELVKLISMSICTLGLGSRVKSDDFCTRFLADVKEYPKLSAGLESFAESSFSIIQRLVNEILRVFGRERINILKTGRVEVDDWLNDVARLSSGYATGSFEPTYENVQEYIRVRMRASKLIGSINDRKISTGIISGLHLLDPIRDRFSSYISRDGAWRPEPPCIALIGKFGVGKSLMTTWLANHIVKRISTESERKLLDSEMVNVFWQRSAGEFADGYNGQPACILDDFGAEKAVSPGTSDTMFLIKAVNTWPFSLNMAKLAEKGITHFTSKVVILTTNHDSFNVFQNDQVYFAGALIRRVHFPFVVTVKPAHWDTQREKLILPSSMDLDAVWSFRLMNLSTGVPHGDEYCFSQVVEMVSQKYKTNTAQFLQMREMLNRSLDDVMPQAGTQSDQSSSYSEPVWGTEHLCDTLLNFAEKHERSPQNFTELLADRPKAECSVPFVDAIRNEMAAYCSGLVTALCLIPLVKMLWHVSTFILGLIFGAIRFVLVGVFRFFFPERFPVQEQSKPDKHTGDAPRSSVARKGGQGKHFGKSGAYELARPQHAVDEQIAQATTKNIYSVLLDADELGCLGSAVMLIGNAMVMPLHFYRLAVLKKDVKAFLFSNVADKQHRFYIDRENFISPGFGYKDVDKDLFFFRAPVAFSAGDMIKRCVKQGDLRNITTSAITIRHHRLKPDATISYRSWTTTGVVRVASTDIKSEELGSYVLADAVRYSADTEAGDCGALVYMADKPGNECRQILGIHVAGSTGKGIGFASVVDQDYLRACVAKISPVVGEVASQHGLSRRELEVDTPGVSQSLFVLDAKRNGSSKTGLFNTRLYNCLEPINMKPAMLRDKGNIKPMWIASSAYCKPRPNLPQNKIDAAMKVAFSRFDNLSVGRSREIFDFKGAVVGDPNDPCNRSIPRGTSSGYPSIFFPDLSNKKLAYFGSEAEFDFKSLACQNLMAEVCEIISDARVGLRREHVFVDFPKDELRSCEKADAGLTRLISGAPLAYIIAFRMYFLSFMTAVQHTNTASGVCIGINPHGPNWSEIAREVKRKGGRCVAGDYKAFDAHGHPQLFWALLDCINHWYNDGPENAHIRSVLWLELVNSKHLAGFGEFAGSLVYQWQTGLPSGHPLTSIANSFENLCLLVLCYHDTVGCMYQFWDHVSPYVYGDDNLLAIAACVLSLYNQSSIELAMAGYGFIYTSELKGSEVVPDHRPIEEVGFLKRGFSFCEDLQTWVAPLERKSVLKSLYWCHNSKLKDEIEIQTFDNFVCERSLHGFSGYDDEVSFVYSTLRAKRSLDKLSTPVQPWSFGQALLRSRTLEY